MGTMGDLLNKKEEQNAVRKEERRKQLEELSQKVENGLEFFLSKSDRYKTYLRVQGMEPRRSVRNAILTALQNPDVTMTQTLQLWKSQGRTVKDIERDKGISVFDGTYGVKQEYDISQTYGKAVPSPAELSHAQKEKMVEDILYIPGVKIVPDEKLEAPAQYVPEDKSVHIRPDLETTELIPYLVPEIVYAKLHSNTPVYFVQEDYHLEAESIQYMLCSHFGLEMPEMNFDKVWTEHAGISDDTRITLLDGQREVARELRDRMGRSLNRGIKEKATQNFNPKGR